MGVSTALIVSMAALAIAVVVSTVAAVFYARLLARERRLGQGQLLEQAKFTSDVFDSLPIGLAMRDLDGRYIFVNRAWENFTGGKRDEVIGRTVHDRAPQDEADAVVAADRAVLALGAGASVPMQDFVFRGRHFMLSRTVLADANGKPRGILVASVDATDRFAMEQAVKDQVALTEAIVEQMPNAVFTKDADGRFTMVNRGWCEMSGVPPEKVLGKTVHDIYPANIADRFTEEDHKLLTQPPGSPPMEAM